jgi:hypothetical protein
MTGVRQMPITRTPGGAWYVRRRAVFLALLGTTAAVRGWRLPLDPIAHADLYLPTWAWAAGWLITAAGCAVGMFWLERWAFTWAAGFMTAWAMLSVGLWLAQDVPGTLTTTVIWGALAGITLLAASWPEGVPGA